MNDQTRSSANFEQINPVRKVEKIENYRGYDIIYFLRPFANTYMGFLGDDFFGFTVAADDKEKYWLMDAKEAIDYYLDKVPFKLPTLEYDIFSRKEEYKPFITALKFVLDNTNKNDKK